MADLDQESINNLIQEIAFTNPNKLKEFKSYEDLGEYYLPRSIGIEIECSLIDNSADAVIYFTESIKSICGIVDCTSSALEQRFRISKGFKGMCALYSALEYMKMLCELNPGSGIHYHVDLTDIYDDVYWLEFESLHKEYLLSELDSWDYKGTYNARGFGILSRSYWLAKRDRYKTIECRIGEMTFDYNLIMKRIFHLTTIIETALGNIDVDKKVKVYKNLEHNINLELTNLNLPNTVVTPEEQVRRIIKSRKIKL